MPICLLSGEENNPQYSFVGFSTFPFTGYVTNTLICFRIRFQIIIDESIFNFNMPTVQLKGQQGIVFTAV